MAGLTIKNARKSYENTEVIHGIDLDIEDGDFVVFVGPSGCGKSTLLRMIAGLEEVSSGEISIGDKIVNDVAPSNRGVAMVFQTYALYPHMTVYKNMAFGLMQAKTPKDEIDRRVLEAAKILDIEEYLDRTPRALSGGQRQRVAIGRAIVREPDVFLFDEPLSNLDAALRGQTRLEIARLHQRLKTTIVYVTHDQVEAMTLADKIVVLRDGLIEQYGPPMELYQNPVNKFVAGFIGNPSMNFFEAQKSKSGFSVGGKTISSKLAKTIDAVDIGIRPEHLKQCTKEKALLSGKLDVLEQLGDHVLAHMVTEQGEEFIAKFETIGNVKHGEMLHFEAMASNIHFFDQKTGSRLG
jgi:multiple sugar transport system ATP-binding protein/alpha-glucoside transport system ATP-binding protein